MNTDEHDSAEKYDINGIEENWEIKKISDQSSLQKIAYSVNVKSTVSILNSLTY